MPGNDVTCSLCPSSLLCLSGDALIYVVMGTAGEYSDRREWPVAAFTDDAVAAELVANASREAKRIHESSASRYIDDEAKWRNPFDPTCTVDYTCPRYFIMKVPFRGILR
jgi:hypothetical protein